ncbi:acetylornithine aminotransferase [Exidia glandulosa HHB12029]|uniref:acetylornithine transaminase n=1 Tax=Exidia glandulosa HHB12029 TaxID=1314781 RepID=A0A165QQ69_EXIGL|nr:acetylornithine aminotransferase [Exidia glandulosa HHB12029]
MAFVSLGRLTRGSLAVVSRTASLRRVVHSRTRLASTFSLPSKPSTTYADISHPEDNAPAEVRKEIEDASRFILPVYARPPVVLASGKGNYVFDSQGRKYLDFTGGIAVNALGHSDEQFAKAMYEQAQQFIHTSNAFYHRNAGALAAEIVRQTQEQGGLGFAVGTPPTDAPSQNDPRVFFSNSGTEANEGALKIARKVAKERWIASGKDGECSQFRVVSFAHAFHGRSMGALSATPNPKYQAPFAPLVPGFDVARLNNTEDVERLVTPDTCAVIVEPIQGEGGVFEAEEGFLKLLRERCNSTGAVLIFDEIQCGLYRTGNLWAHSKLPVECHPDIVTMAKPLANGYPVGAVLMRGNIAQAMTVGSHGTTFGGSPMATALGLHVLRRLQALSGDVLETGAYLEARLSQLAAWYPELVGPVRGRGLILGLPFKGEGTNAKVVEMARQRGVLLLTAGKDVVRFVPSLTVTGAEVDHAVEVLEGCLGRLA